MRSPYPWIMNRSLFVFVLLLCMAFPTAASAAAHRALAGPQVRVWVQAPEYRTQVRQVLPQIERITGMQFVSVTSPAAADVRITLDSKLHCVGTAGEAIAGEWAHLAQRCTPAARTIILAHELGHVLGLSHQSGCSIMNDKFKFRGNRAWPRGCAPGVVTATNSYTKADARILRALYRNRAPQASFLLDTATIASGEAPYLTDETLDPDGNLASLRIDWGTGEPFSYTSASGVLDFVPPQLIEQATPYYETPGTYQITVTATDTYGLSHSQTQTLTVTDSGVGAEGDWQVADEEW